MLFLIALMASGSSAWPQSGPGTAPIAAGGLTTGAFNNRNPSEESLAASIHGVVAGKNGELYQGVRVTLTLTGPGAPPSRIQTTDSDGAFTFTDIAAAPFTLTFSSRGFTTQKISGVLHVGENYDAQTIVLSMAEASIDVQVTASQAEIAVEQFHEEEHQRVLGIIPNYYVTYVPNAPPLTTRQKFNLAWKTTIDPLALVAAGGFAGMEQAGNAMSGYGQGAQGYAKRFGANYADTFIGTFIGGAVLPTAFKQDPRYFYKGTGTVRSRTFYAIANAIVCKGDNGRWQFDYSGILGSLAAGGLSNLYYPASDRGDVGLTFENTGISIAGSAIGNLFQEFVVHRLTPRIPHYAPSNQ